MIRQLFGCEPDKSGPAVLGIAAGTIGDYYGPGVIDLPQRRDIDLTRRGLWALDTGNLRTGDLYVYSVVKDATPTSPEERGLMCSQSGLAGGITYPPGFYMARKLPVAFRYDPRWDGIPDFHLSHWPMPEILYTKSEYSGLWTALANGQSRGAWSSLDLSPWLPDTGRMAILNIEVRYAGGSAGSGYIRSTGAQPTGMFVGSAQPAAGSFTCQKIRVTSSRTFEWKTTPGVAMYIYVLGYDMSDPS